MLAQAHGCPSIRKAAPRWCSTRTPVTARHHHTTPATSPSPPAAERAQGTPSARDMTAARAGFASRQRTTSHHGGRNRPPPRRTRIIAGQRHPTNFPLRPPSDTAPRPPSHRGWLLRREVSCESTSVSGYARQGATGIAGSGRGVCQWGPHRTVPALRPAPGSGHFSELCLPRQLAHLPVSELPRPGAGGSG